MIKKKIFGAQKGKRDEEEDKTGDGVVVKKKVPGEIRLRKGKKLASNVLKNLVTLIYLDMRK